MAILLSILLILIAWAPGGILSTPEPKGDFPTARDKMAGMIWLGLPLLAGVTAPFLDDDARSFTHFYWFAMMPTAVAGMAGRQPFLYASIVIVAHEALVLLLYFCHGVRSSISQIQHPGYCLLYNVGFSSALVPAVMGPTEIARNAELIQEVLVMARLTQP